MTEVRLPVWYAHERAFPRFVDIVALGPRSSQGGRLVRMQHIVRGSDNCMRCGRNITNDASKLVGYGPDCCEKLGVARPTMETAMEVLDALKSTLGQAFEAWMPAYLVNRVLTQKQQDALPSFGRGGEPARAPEASQPRPVQPAAAPAAGPLRQIIQEGQTLHFRFAYDAEIKDLIKAAGGRWDGVRGAWGEPSHWTARVTPESSQAVADLVTRHGFQAGALLSTSGPIAQDKPAAVAAPAPSNTAASLAETSTFALKGTYLRTLRPYQVAGVEFMVKNVKPMHGVYNGDVMGLGKTVETIVALNELQAYPAIVVTTASTKFNWRNEFANWLGDTVTVAVLNGKASVDPRQADVVIVNYDILDKWMPVITGLKAKAVVFDEAQKLKNSDMVKVDGDWGYKTQRVQAASSLVQGIPLRFMLSGTAVKNRPLELVSQLDVLGRLRDLGGRTAFKERFCAPKFRTSKSGRMVLNGRGEPVKDFNGASNVDELNRRMRQGFYVRREREQVLKELPAKSRVHYEFALSNRAEYDALEDDFQERIEAGEKGAALVRFTKLTQMAVDGIIDQVRDWMEDFFEQEEHLILFAWHNDVADKLAAAFDAPKIVGSTPLAKRQQIVDEFQAGKHRLVVANIQAGGEGITLTRAHHVAFAQLAWTPADHDQAESRAHRFGQQQPVTAHYFTAPETIYDDVMQILRSKWNVTDAVNIGNLAGYGMSEIEVKRTIMERIAKRVARRRAERNAA